MRKNEAGKPSGLIRKNKNYDAALASLEANEPFLTIARGNVVPLFVLILVPCQPWIDQ